MKTKIYSLTVLTTVFLLLLTSCKKEVEGPVGPKGPSGIDGNSNVKSYTVNVASSNWTLSGNVYYFDVPVAGITSSIINSGDVRIFMESTASVGVWLNMPWIDYFSSSAFSTYNYNYSLGGVRIFKTDSNLLAPTNPGVRNFKIVVVESSGMITNPDLDWTDYSQIEKVLHSIE